MNRRLLLVGFAVGLFAMIVIGTMPAAATPCTNLQSLQLQHTTITSATDWAPGTFPPNSPSNLTAFCRVIATLTPTSDSPINIEVWLPETSWNGKFLGIGGGGFQGPITSGEYSELATGIGLGFATAISPSYSPNRHTLLILFAT